MNKIILCQTPLHLFLAFALKENDVNYSKITIVLVRESLFDKGFLEFVCQGLNADILNLKGANNIRFQLGRTTQRLINVFRLRCFFLNKKISQLLVFNDSTPEALYLIDMVVKKNGKVVLGEDGVAIYELGGIQPVTRSKFFIGRIFYGRWWRPKDRVGWCESLTTVFSTYPELVRKDIRCADIRMIPAFAKNDGVAISNVCLGQDFDAENYVLCVIPFVDSVGFSSVEVFIRSVIEKFPFVAFKFHPRESAFNINKVSNFPLLTKAKIIKNDIPVEIVFLGEKAPRVVVGFRSSALHMIKKISPHVKVYFYEVLDGNQFSWINFYKEVGIGEFK